MCCKHPLSIGRCLIVKIHQIRKHKKLICNILYKYFFIYAKNVSLCIDGIYTKVECRVYTFVLRNERSSEEIQKNVDN